MNDASYSEKPDQAETSTFILASASATRQELLRSAGIAFVASPSAVDERRIQEQGGFSPKSAAAALARAKALSVSIEYPAALVLCADQTLECDGLSLHKADSRAAVIEQLQLLRGKPHCLHSAMALAKDGVILWQYTETITLHCRAYSDSFIQDYADAVCASGQRVVGCYAFESIGVQLFDTVSGSQSGILGLPLLPLCAVLRELGVLKE